MIQENAKPAAPVQHFVPLPSLPLDQIILGDNCEVMRTLPSESIDLVVTSPPYDDLRTYGGHSWDFYGVAWNLKRLLKPGGVIVWVVGDATKDGSETGSSWKQAHHFQAIGLRIHDTMIYRKQNYTPLTHNRYEQEWEYTFIISNGKPKTFNPKMVECTYAGSKTWGEPNMYKDNSGSLTRVKQTVINDKKIAGNIFTYEVGSRITGAINHPAMFPEALARDQILNWSNEGDIVLDPFSGSGTTAKMAKHNGRRFIGIEVNPEYVEISQQRLAQGVLF
jgi:site-specific DNA-methyltransferase (adenine-specific)